MPDDIVVTAVARTPFGRFGGALQTFPHDRLGAIAVDALLMRAAIDPSLVQAAYIGVGMIAAGVLTPARRIVLGSSLPDSTPSLTVDRACCSGLTAAGLAAIELIAGDSDIVIAGGVESLSNTPRLAGRMVSSRPGSAELSDPLLLRTPFGDTAISVYSGEEALAHGIDRLQQDEWALGSHRRYFQAEERGDFAFERVAVAGADGKTVLDTDEGPRRNTSLEALRRLKTVYSGPTVTAGNAPGLNDGAAMLLLARAAAAKALGLPALARIIGYAQIAGEKTSGTWTPAIAIQRVLDKHDIGLPDLAALEINEAYAATPLVSTEKLADGNRGLRDQLRGIGNVHGGAVAIGHPMGASGARILMSLINVLRRAGGGYGVAAICGGYGQGDAMLVKVDP